MRTALFLALALAAPAAAEPVIRSGATPLFGSHDFRVYEDRADATAVHAAAPSFSAVDRNDNHRWDPPEIRSAFGPAARDVVLAFDANGDGDVTRLELRAYADAGTTRPDGTLWEPAPW
jgi:hypothetical protein